MRRSRALDLSRLANAGDLERLADWNSVSGIDRIYQAPKGTDMNNYIPGYTRAIFLCLVMLITASFAVSCNSEADDPPHLIIMIHDLQSLRPDTVQNIGLRGWLEQHNDGIYLTWEEQRFVFAESMQMDVCVESLIGSEVTVFGEFAVNDQQFVSMSGVEEFLRTTDREPIRCRLT